MSRKTIRPSFDQVLETLRSHGFAVSPFQGAPNGQLVSKSGAAAILVPIERYVRRIGQLS